MVKRLIKLGLSLMVYAVDRVSRWAGSPWGRRSGEACVVVYYHGIRVEERASFARQLDVILRTSSPVSALDRGKPANGRRRVAITFDDALRSFRDIGLPEIRKRQLPIVVFVPTGFLGQEVGWAMGGDTSSKADQVLSQAELREIGRDPLVRFGSHTVSHPRLPRLDAEGVLKEMVESKQFLETSLGCVVDSISFPYGAFGDRELRIAMRAGYSTWFSTCPTPLYGEGAAGLLGRVRTDPGDWPLEFELKLAGAYRWEPYLRRLRTWGSAAPAVDQTQPRQAAIQVRKGKRGPALH